MRAVTTLFHKDVWASKLRDHPDKHFSTELIDFIEHGVPLLFKGPTLSHIYPNWKSIDVDREKVEVC
jgi:hypothetical protein